MMSETLPPAFGHTIFCDDIRNEISSKVSYIGAYRGLMVIHEPLPLTLPKFAFGITYYEKRGLSTSAVRIKIYLPGDKDDSPSVEAEIPFEQIRQAQTVKPPRLLPEESDIALLHRFETHIVLAPLTIQKGGSFKVRAVVNEEVTIKMGAMHVLYSPRG